MAIQADRLIEAIAARIRKIFDFFVAEEPLNFGSSCLRYCGNSGTKGYFGISEATGKASGYPSPIKSVHMCTICYSVCLSDRLYLREATPLEVMKRSVT